MRDRNKIICHKFSRPTIYSSTRKMTQEKALADNRMNYYR
uniref:Uncharacterized protein n=1 Tax=Arundo donax TaxID=35708 RepID=A0A0A9B3J6_ARUDO